MSASRSEGGGGQRVEVSGDTYATVETQDTIRLEDMHKCGEHALGAIWGASLKADLLGVSSSFRTSRGCCLPTFTIHSISFQSINLL